MRLGCSSELAVAAAQPVGFGRFGGPLSPRHRRSRHGCFSRRVVLGCHARSGAARDPRRARLLRHQPRPRDRRSPAHRQTIRRRRRPRGDLRARTWARHSRRPLEGKRREEGARSTSEGIHNEDQPGHPAWMRLWTWGRASPRIGRVSATGAALRRAAEARRTVAGGCRRADAPAGTVTRRSAARAPHRLHLVTS